jgi:hypothetical protein
VRRAFEVTKDAAAAAFAEAAHRYSVFYQPTGDGRATARDARVRGRKRLPNLADLSAAKPYRRRP